MPSKWQKIYQSPHNNNIVTEIQQILADKKYYKGEIDNILGEKTKKALLQFQKDNTLPIGRLDRQTLIALNVPSFKTDPFYRVIKWE